MTRKILKSDLLTSWYPIFLLSASIGMNACTDLRIKHLNHSWLPGDREIVVTIENNSFRSETLIEEIFVSAEAQSSELGIRRLIPHSQLKLTEKVKGLDEGESKTVTFSFPGPVPGFKPGATRQIKVKVDDDDRYSEFSEKNNVRDVCVNYQVPDRVCWLQPQCLITLDDMDVLVRTVNTEQGRRHYPKRLTGIADLFFEDWPDTIGLIGLQEVKEDMTGCPIRPPDEGRINGTECFRRLLQNRFNKRAWSYFGNGELGVVIGTPWVPLEYATYDLGGRYLLEVKVWHRSKGYYLKFYNTHLSHRRNKEHMEERNKQIEKIVDIVRNNAEPGELPPIVVGDFNFMPGIYGWQENYRRMNEHFSLQDGKVYECDSDTLPERFWLDQTWIGKTWSFPGSENDWMRIRYHKTPGSSYGIKLATEHTVEDYTGKLSDHDSPGFTFKVIQPD